MKREWLSEHRKSKRLTQQQVALGSFIDRSYYSQIESGKRNPSLPVATNIAKVLDVDPLLFFQDHLVNTNDEVLADIGISTYFKNIDKGLLFYLYNSHEKYIRNAVTFCLTSVEKSSVCILLDSKENCYQIKQQLEVISKNKLSHNVISIFQDSKDSLQQLLTILSEIEDNLETIYIWSRDKREWLSNLHPELEGRSIDVKTIIVDCYNATKMSASEHIKMMRKIPYLMTDTEIYTSPLYDSSNKSEFLPALYIQENL